MRYSRHRGSPLANGYGLVLSKVVLLASAILACSSFASDARQDSSNGPTQPLLTSGADLPWSRSVIGRLRLNGPSPAVRGLGWQAVASRLTSHSMKQDRQVLLHGRTRKRLDITNPLPRLNLRGPNGADGHDPTHPQRGCGACLHREEADEM